MQKFEAVKQYVNEVGGDGHTIFAPEYLVKMGFDQAFVNKFTYTEKSGKNPKSWLFDNNGCRVKEIKGVYSLSFAYGIANDIGADTKDALSKMGRGFQAQELMKAIRVVLDKSVVAA